MIVAGEGIICGTTVINHCYKILIVKRPGGGTKYGGAGLSLVRDNFPITLEVQDGTIGSGRRSGAV